MKTQTQLRKIAYGIISELEEAFSQCNFAFNCAYRHDIVSVFTEWTWTSSKKCAEDNDLDIQEALDGYLKAGVMLDDMSELWLDQNKGIGAGQQVLKMISEQVNDLSEGDWIFREIQQTMLRQLYQAIKNFAESQDEEGQELLNEVANNYRAINNTLATAVNKELEICNAAV